ncbi:MAG: DUF4199 domain-containing protein [Bacteroidales bacterium]|nr:DUF4199 domain-containing protein [Bacteroidales bacterium]
MTEINDKGLITRQLMTYGAIIGIITTVYSLILFSSGINEFTPSPDAPFIAGLRPIIVGLGIYYSVRHLATKILKIRLKFGKFLLYGILIGLFFSIIDASYYVIFLKYISPSTLDKILETSSELYKSWNIPYDAEMAKNIMSKPFVLFMVQLFGSTFQATVYSLIFAVLYTFTSKLTQKKD